MSEFTNAYDSIMIILDKITFLPNDILFYELHNKRLKS